MKVWLSNRTFILLKRQLYVRGVGLRKRQKALIGLAERQLRVDFADPRTERDVRIHNTDVRANWLVRMLIAVHADLGVGMLIAV